MIGGTPPQATKWRKRITEDNLFIWKGCPTCHTIVFERGVVSIRKRWSREQAWEWQERKGWIVGCNFIPSRCINNIEIWQEFEFEDVLNTIRRELQLASSIGMNSIRMLLPFYVWKHQRDGFLQRIDRVLSAADQCGISLMPIFFDDCTLPRQFHREPVFGKQRDPVPGHHGGVVHTPFDGGGKVGYNLSDDKENWPVLEEYVRDIMGTFARDERILMWDMWNEPGNSNRNATSMEFMIRVFEIGRSIDPIQPLTAGPWEFGDGYLRPYHGVAGLSEIEKKAMELSDVITYHYYGNKDNSIRLIQELKQEGRPLLITEWLHRPFGNKVADLLPVFKQEGVGCFNWGLVAGKTQTYEPWDAIRKIPGLDLKKWQHDLFYSDFMPYREEEIETFKELTSAR